ncbi:UNVERIFIED_CONTAM: hypothetical protein FKN15_007082 [Acipenser sinensis]
MFTIALLNSESQTSDAKKLCSGPGVHSDNVTAQIQGTEAKSLPRAAVSSQSERKAFVSTGATPGDEAAIKAVDSMPDKVAAAGKENAEEGSVMWEDVEEEELSDSSSMMMDETLTNPQAQIQGTEVKSLPRAAVSSQSERKAFVSTGATPGDEAAIKAVDSMPDKVAAAGKENAEEGSVMWEDVEEEELSDSSSMMMDETLTNPQGKRLSRPVSQPGTFSCVVSARKS